MRRGSQANVNGCNSPASVRMCFVHIAAAGFGPGRGAVRREAEGPAGPTQTMSKLLLLAIQHENGIATSNTSMGHGQVNYNSFSDTSGWLTWR